MTKKDYKMIADAFAGTADYIADFQIANMVIESLCVAFKKDNPRFDKEKFISACRIK